MEKTVTLRFYEVTRSSPDKPAMVDLLDRIAALPLAEREKRIGEEQILVRLENYEREEDCVSGQFIRGQSGNRPGRMHREGTNALPFREPLGHGIAFRYRATDGLLAVQYDVRVLSPSRIMSYLEAHDARAEFHLEPRLRDDAWERFEQLPVRKLEVSIAGHPNVEDAERDDDSVWANVARMKQQYGADTIRFQISMGHRGGALSEGIKQIAREAFRRHERYEEDIRAIKGVLDTGEGVPNDEVDLMGELFDAKADLSFEEDDWERFYELRHAMLRDRIRFL